MKYCLKDVDEECLNKLGKISWKEFIESIGNVMLENVMEDKLKKQFKHFMDILDLFEQRQYADGLTYITQLEISSLLGISQTNISKRLKILIKYEAIEKVTPGIYKLLHNDLDYTPYPNVVRVAHLLNGNPSLIGKYKAQSEILSMDINEVQQAWGYIYALFQKEIQ